MNGNGKWYVMFAAALGMASGLVGNEIASLESWEPVTAPAFLGKVLIHLGTVIAAFVAGKNLPQS